MTNAAPDLSGPSDRSDLSDARHTTLQCHCAAPSPNCKPARRSTPDQAFRLSSYPRATCRRAPRMGHAPCARSRRRLDGRRTRSGRMQDPWLPEREPDNDEFDELFAEAREAWPGGGHLERESWRGKIGRASCRERVEIAVGAVSLEKNK